jgi:hypothetical protein
VPQPDVGEITSTATPLRRTISWLQSNWLVFAWRKTQWDVGRRRRLPALPAPTPGVTPHSIVTAVITASAQLFEDPDQRQLFASGLAALAASSSSSSAAQRPGFWGADGSNVNTQTRSLLTAARAGATPDHQMEFGDDLACLDQGWYASFIDATVMVSAFVSRSRPVVMRRAMVRADGIR